MHKHGHTFYFANQTTEKEYRSFKIQAEDVKKFFYVETQGNYSHTSNFTFNGWKNLSKGGRL